MIDGYKGHKQIRTLVKSLDEVRRRLAEEGERAGAGPLPQPPHPYLLAQAPDPAPPPRGT